MQLLEVQIERQCQTADQEIRRVHDTAAFLKLLHEPDSVIEVRIPKCPQKVGGDFTSTASGYFSDLNRAATEIARIERQSQPSGVYVTMNPVDPSLLGRRNNRIQLKVQDTTTDYQVLRRRWLLLDFDPRRPAGISSTDAEMNAALALAHHVRESLEQEGWAVPIEGMSGNGAYLLYRVDLPNDAESTEIIQKVLKNLASRFDTDTVNIDTAVSNPSRIIKVLGTVVRKGDQVQGVPGTDDRPHRRSWFIQPLKPLAPVPVERLKEKAEIVKREENTCPSSMSRAEPADTSSTNRVDRCWSYLSKCPDAISGQGGHAATFRAACECYRFGLSDDEARTIMQKFNDQKTGGEPWTDREIEHKLQDARKKVEADGELECRMSTSTNERANRYVPDPPARESTLERIGRKMFRGSGWKLSDVQLHGQIGGLLVLDMAKSGSHHLVPIGTVGEALGQNCVRAAIIDATGFPIPRFAAGQWDKVVALLRQVATVIVGDTPDDELNEWIESFAHHRLRRAYRYDLDDPDQVRALFFDIHPNAKSDARYYHGEAPGVAFDKSGHALVRLEALVKWLRIIRHANLTRIKITHRLSMAGWKSRQLSAWISGQGRSIKARYWHSPHPYLPELTEDSIDRGCGDVGDT